MRLRQAMAGLGNAEIAVLRIGAQAIGFEILFAVMTDGDALFRTRARFGGRQRAGLGLARGGFGDCFAGGLARGRFFQRGVFAAVRDLGYRPAIDALLFE